MNSNDVSYKKPGKRWMNSELPDINIKLPAVTGGAVNSPPNMSPGSSKTITLEREELLEHVKHPKTKSLVSLDESPHADAGNRWLKRLKLSSNSSIQGGKSPDYASTTPQERMSELFDSIPRSTMTRSKPNLSKHRGERSVLSDKNRGFELENRFIENPNDKAEALLLSHAWIQRLLSNGGRKSKRESGTGTEAVLEPEGSKLALEKLEKEQLPSIAAMALMAKVLTCFQQCELQTKGSYTVWNTKTLL